MFDDGYINIENDHKPTNMHKLISYNPSQMV